MGPQPSGSRGPGFGYSQRGFSLVKFQITNPKKQTNNNDLNSKSQTKDNHFKPVGICDLFVIWCLEFGILGEKTYGRAR
jgi:hypothetical protein